MDTIFSPGEGWLSEDVEKIVVKHGGRVVNYFLDFQKKHYLTLPVTPDMQWADIRRKVRIIVKALEKCKCCA